MNFNWNLDRIVSIFIVAWYFRVVFLKNFHSSKPIQKIQKIVLYEQKLNPLKERNEFSDWFDYLKNNRIFSK